MEIRMCIKQEKKKEDGKKYRTIGITIKNVRNCNSQDGKGQNERAQKKNGSRCERQPKKIKVPLIMALGLFLMHIQFHYMQTAYNLNKIDKLQTFKLSLFK